MSQRWRVPAPEAFSPGIMRLPRRSRLRSSGAATAASFVWPRLWLLALPALIPVASFAPWTGSMLVEEIDLLALAFAAGAYARMPAPRAGQPRDAGERVSSSHLSIVAVVLVLLFALSTAVSLHRGVVDAGGWQLGLVRRLLRSREQRAHREGLHARAAVRAASRRRDAEVGAMARSVFWPPGFAIGAGAAALGVVWERHAFTGLLNFSSDYRATAMFWEMHVGGAALDGFLALGVPFVVWALRAQLGATRRADGRTMGDCGVGGAVAARRLRLPRDLFAGVYLAVPLSLSLLFLLLSPARDGTPSRQLTTLVKGVLAIAVGAAGSYLVFRAGGYRSLLAVLGVFALSLRASSALRGASWLHWGMASLLGGVLAVVGVAAGSVFAKGPYVVYAAAFMLCLALTVLNRSPNDAAGAPEALTIATLGSWLWAAFAAVHVARHWGGESARWDTAMVVALLAILAVVRTRLVQAALAGAAARSRHRRRVGGRRRGLGCRHAGGRVHGRALRDVGTGFRRQDAALARRPLPRLDAR
jgi:hypothetical protein